MADETVSSCSRTSRNRPGFVNYDTRREEEIVHLREVRFRFVTTTAFAAAVAAVLVGTAMAVGVAVTVSGPSPYASCSNAGQPGTNYVNAEVEPWVAANPANSSNLIGVWQQDRWSNGGAHGLVAGFSPDGGTTWG